MKPKRYNKFDKLPIKAKRWRSGLIIGLGLTFKEVKAIMGILSKEEIAERERENSLRGASSRALYPLTPTHKLLGEYRGRSYIKYSHPKNAVMLKWRSPYGLYLCGSQGMVAVQCVGEEGVWYEHEASCYGIFHRLEVVKT